jgi:hypothetical protein
MMPKKNTATIDQSTIAVFRLRLLVSRSTTLIPQRTVGGVSKL